MALYTLNITGWHAPGEEMWTKEQLAEWDQYTTALFISRVRLVVLTAPAVAWLAIGLAGLYANLVVPRLPRG